MLKDFRDFLFRGNVVDLAIAIVIGTAFTALVKALVADLFTPLLSIPGHVNFEDLSVRVDHSVFRYGDFLNDLIAFVLLAAVVYFIVVRPVESMSARRKLRQGPAEPATKDCPECCTEIAFAARRCPACTAVLEAA